MRTIISSLLLFSILLTPAWASERGVFVSVGWGPASYGNAPLNGGANFGCFLISTGDCSSFSASTNTDIGVGYHYNEYLGVEARYSNIGESTSSGNSTIGSTTRSSSEVLSGSSTQIAVVGTHAFNDSFDLIGKLGLASTTLDYKISETVNSVTTSDSASGTDISLMWGLGVQYNVNQQWGINLEYESIGEVQVGSTGEVYDSKIEVDIYSLGVVYSF